ncbi:hypothetical protein [Trueperella sp. LYQ141]|uniref:hypothetical protein n=1 Tax=Trueperella sp. LYQ141 TaxID=3391058 RepID=UPI0039831A69
MSRRNPGRRPSASEVICRATLAASGVAMILAAIGICVCGQWWREILIAAWIIVGINLLNAVFMALLVRYFTRFTSAFSILSYLVKIGVMALAMVLIRHNAALNVRVVFGVVVLFFAVSLVMYGWVVTKSSALYIADYTEPNSSC